MEKENRMPHWTTADIPSQAGRVAVVTGANSGIGWHTALELARKSGEVILTARTAEKGRDAVERIRREVPAADVRAELLDLASLASVRAFAGRMEKEPRLDLLVNNAGVMAVPTRRLTEDGFELQLGTNFLGHFALTGLLLPSLSRGSGPRIVTISSGAANLGPRRICFEDLQLERSYGPWKAYCQSKLADLMLTLESARRFEQRGIRIVSNAAHPGYARTNLQTSGPGKPPSGVAKLVEKLLSQDAAMGALPTLRAATAPEATAGTYFAPGGLMELRGYPVSISFPGPARKPEDAVRLWNLAEELTGVRWP
jgi:NAD(P)-dependent dehydrogenase (short-subunit alcohol dehydrogenase family)